MRLTRFLLFSLSIFFLSVLVAQAQDKASKKNPQDIFQKIDRAYQQGKLNIDQKVLYKLYAIKNPKKLPGSYKTKDLLLKCGTPAISDFQLSKSKLSSAAVTKGEALTSAPQMQASETYQSPSGNFTIHYETTGEDAVPPADSDNDNTPDYVEKVAAAADSSYHHEVQNLGYTDPLGSSNNIDIYIRNLSVIYGQSNGTSIEIENDFSEGFPPNDDPEGMQVGAVKVTVAHELKHVIQYSVNQFQGETFYWLEMDATMMEEVVYDNVNDYYNYISSPESIFSNPQLSFYPGSYYHVTWALFYEQKFGSQFWVDVWEIIKANPNITLLDAITQQLGGVEAYNQSYIESQLWHFASGANSISTYGFEESNEYPTPSVSFNFVGDDSLAAPDILQRLSASYFDIQASPFSGSVAFNFSDFDTSPPGFGVIGYFNDGSVEPLIFYDDQQETISYETDWQWQEIERIGIVATNGSLLQQAKYGLSIRSVNPQMVSVTQNYPNPFREQTIIRYSIPEQKQVRLEVFDVLGRKVATLVDESQPKGIYPTLFSPEGLASGVYFYRLIIDGEVTTKKMTLIK